MTEPSNSGQQHPLLVPLKAIFDELASPNATVVKAAVAKLNALAEEEGDSLFHRTNAVNIQSKVLPRYIETQLQNLLSKPETRLGGILAIEALRDVEYTDFSVRLSALSNLLLKVVHDPSQASQEAARVWGILMNSSSGLTTDIVTQQLGRCIEWLLAPDALSSAKKFVGALLFQHVAEKCAGSVVTRFEELMKGLWAALKDPQDFTRLAAATALRKGLDVVYHTADPAATEVWIDNLISSILKALVQKPKEVVHGALLALNAWLGAAVCSSRPVPVNNTKTRELFLFIVGQLQKPSSYVELRSEVVTCVPLLAQYDKPRFVETCLQDFVLWAGNCYRNTSGPDERGPMFIAIGQLAAILQDKVPVFIDRVMSFIEGSLTRKPKRERCPQAVSCFAMIATADTKSTRSYLHMIMNPLFQCTPTVEFAKDIAVLCSAFPELRTSCMARVVEATRAQFQSIRPRNSLTAASEDDTGILLNALNTLLSLDFSGYSVLPFLTEVVTPFVQDPHEAVRRASIALCLKLVLSGCHAPGSPCKRDALGVMIHDGHQHMRLILHVVKSLINAAVADTESDIRLRTLEQLTEEYDQTLALQDCVRALFPALNDKHQNRIATVGLLGRLAKRNPACVLPMLRRVLLQCITEIQYFGNVKKQEQSTLVLSAVVDAAPSMVRPYVSALLQSTITRLRDKALPAVVQTALLSSVGKLVCFTDEVDLAAVNDVRSIVVSHIMDSSCPPKRQEAIRALGSIVRATRETSIYEEHPQLLNVLLASLHGGFKEPWPIRQDVLNLMGIIGAVDPVKVKRIIRKELKANSAAAAAAAGGTDSASTVRLRPEEAAAHTTIKAILDVIELPSTHDEQCLQAIQAIVHIFTSREMQLTSIISFYPRVIPSVVRHINTQTKLRDRLFKQLTTLVGVAKHHIRAHLDDIFDTLKKYLPGDDIDVLASMLQLLVELRRSLNEEFRPHLREVLPLLVLAAQEDPHRSAEKVFDCVVSFGKLMEGHLHLVLPCIIEIGGSAATNFTTRMAAIAAVTSFAKQLMCMSDHAARCVHCFSRILQEPQRSTSTTDRDEKDQLGLSALTALLAIAQNLGPAFEKFRPVVRPVVAARFGETNVRYLTFRNVTDEAIMSRARVIAPEPPRPLDDSQRFAPPPLPNRRKDDGRFNALRTILAPMERSGEEEWKQWLRQFAIELLRTSPCLAHGYALTLAQIHEPFARQLFHAAFAACFGEMDDSLKQDVVALLTNVLRNPKLPSEVLQELLNLSEYIERCDSSTTAGNPPTAQATSPASSRGLFDIQTLIDRSEKCSLHAKALHYLEVQFTELTREYERGLLRGRIVQISEENWRDLLEAAEKSIYLCNLLGQKESAGGTLTYIQEHFARLTGGSLESSFAVLDAELLEKLQWWSQSLKAYQERLKTDPNNLNSMRGAMTAMDNQGDFGKLLETYKTFARRIPKKDASTLAPMGARAAWILQNWDEMEQITSLMRNEGYTGITATYYNAVIAVHKRKFREASALISKCRRELDGELSALVAESYDRAYEMFVGNQQLCELEEIIFALKEPSQLSKWKDLWERRLLTMAYEGWQGTLATHSLVLPHTQEITMWVRFVSLCRIHGRERVSNEVLQRLLGARSVADVILNSDVPPKPLVALSALTHMFELGKRDQALQLLKTYTEKVELRTQGGHKMDDPQEYAVCRTRLAEWTAMQHASDFCFNRPLTEECLRSLQRATELDPSNGAIWHSWARMHHDIATKAQNRFGALEQHVTCALDGYLRSIGLNQNLQDVLGFLSLWFAYGTCATVEASGVLKNMSQVNTNVWLRVIPQIIARIHTPNSTLNEHVHSLLAIIGRVHPQALLYSLNVNSGATVGIGVSMQLSQDMLERRKAGQRVLSRITELHHNGPQLVGDAVMVCQELVRCAVLWTELWYDELDRAWLVWQREKDPQLVWQIIEPLMKLFERPETMAETHFVSEFGAHLEGAAALIRDAASMPNHKARDMDEAWGMFKSVVERIDQQINSMTSLAMQLVSPRLLQSGKNLSLVVPGQYTESGEYPRIAGFVGTLKVMSSKQHPRRISINGSDGAVYKFLLKGHEDLRLDERVMQLLGLVNTLLSSSNGTNSRDHFVQVYSVTPLSENAGLVGWVDNCDTLHQIIKDHRVQNKQISAELNLMRLFCDDLNKLTVMQRVEPFEFALEGTEGNDLARSLWIRAPSAESWLDRRTTYVRTLASMSMVGHILGLGDRHPSNIMISAFSGRVVHIDFGDCFEVAQHRQMFPEKVPFRLTRMLIKAMEVGGINGLFRHGCVSVMTVLREEKGTLLAMLEAFLHDPLITWWRDEGDTEQKDGSTTSAPSTATATKPQLSDAVVGSIYSVTERSVRRRAASGAAMINSERLQTKKAQRVLNRINEKLNGREFDTDTRYQSASLSAGTGGRESMVVEDQVTRLIEEATCHENLAQHFSGWCPFW